MTNEQTVEDILTIEDYHVRASVGKRFANYIIDLIVFYLIAFGIGILIAVLSPATIDNYANDRSGINLFDRLLYLVLYAVYMSIVESVFKGKSLGKVITKTRAVNLDGSPISTSTAFARGFSRAVPFCVFSAFGSPCDPWQDRWTNTMVIDESKKM